MYHPQKYLYTVRGIPDSHQPEAGRGTKGQLYQFLLLRISRLRDTLSTRSRAMRICSLPCDIWVERRVCQSTRCQPLLQS